MEGAEAPRHPTGSARYVLKRVDMSRFRTRRRFWWFPDYSDEQMHAQLQRENATLKAWDAAHPEFMAELDAMADEVMAGLPDYDWGPEGPPS